MPVWIPPSVIKSDDIFESLLRYALQKDQSGSWMAMVTGGVNGSNVYALPLNAGGVSVATQAPKSNVVNASTGSANQIACDSSAPALVANGNRRRWMIQNINTAAVYVLLGTGTVSTTNFHFALQGGTVANDGKGGSFSDDTWTGAVQVLGQGAAGSNKVIVTEL